MIKDISNSIQKEVKALHRRKSRDEKKLFFIEGLRFVNEALSENIDIKYIVISETFKRENDVSQLLNSGVNIYLASDKIIKELSDTDTPQGIIGVIPYLQFENKTSEKQGHKTYVVLDAIQDPGNMGTIIRTSDAVNVDRIVLSKGCVDIYNPKVLRATMGSIFRVSITRVEDLKDYIIGLKHQNFEVLAAHLKGTENYFHVDLTGNTAIVIGNEANGICDEVSLACDKLVKIPMLGNIESLNAGVSASIILYEILRQRSS